MRKCFSLRFRRIATIKSSQKYAQHFILICFFFYKRILSFMSFQWHESSVYVQECQTFWAVISTHTQNVSMVYLFMIIFNRIKLIGIYIHMFIKKWHKDMDKSTNIWAQQRSVNCSMLFCYHYAVFSCLCHSFHLCINVFIRQNTPYVNVWYWTWQVTHTCVCVKSDRSTIFL